MSFTRALLVSTSFISTSFAALAADAPPPTAATAPASQGGFITRQELPALVRDALMNDPNMIMDAVKKFKEQQAAEARKKAQEALVKNKEAVFNDASAPSLGDAKTADVTIVEFFDYHCGYCRHLLPDLTKLYKEDGKLRVVFKEFPILSDDSTAAARAALAVNRIAKDKYFDYHTALMKHEGKYDEKSLLDIGKKLGIATDKLKTEMAKPEITAELDRTRALAEELGIRGTPAVIIGDELSPGAVPFEEMKKMVAIARGSAKPPIAPAAPAAAAPATPSAPAAAAPIVSPPPAIPTPPKAQ